MNRKMTTDVIAYADQHGFTDEPTSIGMGGLHIVRAHEPSVLKSTLYRPLLCFVLQGQKETKLGEQTITFSAGDTLIVSITIPTASQIKIATSIHPYVALALEVDLSIIRELQSKLGLNSDDTLEHASITSGSCGVDLAHAIEKLFYLHDKPLAEQTVIAPLLIREIHFRMLYEGHGGMLRRLAHLDSHESRINKAILKIQKDFSEPLAVKDLALLSGMSLSSFHEHFKAITAATPLQFIKNLRLLVAQQKLLSTTESVSTIGYDVGYESVAHFSRDYDRKFGYPPSQKRRR
jgi:AraC-like DNA-binding protein